MNCGKGGKCEPGVRDLLGIIVNHGEATCGTAAVYQMATSIIFYWPQFLETLNTGSVVFGILMAAYPSK